LWERQPEIETITVQLPENKIISLLDMPRGRFGELFLYLNVLTIDEADRYQMKMKSVKVTHLK
jgi:hypothetical protein